MGTSSSEVLSSVRGISSTSSSEEEEEKEGEAERSMELVEEDVEGRTLKREMLRPIVWKMEAREGLLGGAATGGVWGVNTGGAGGAYGGGGGEATGGGGGSGSGSKGGGASRGCCCTG